MREAWGALVNRASVGVAARPPGRYAARVSFDPSYRAELPDVPEEPEDGSDPLDEPVMSAADLLADAEGKSLPPRVVAMNMSERIADMKRKNVERKPRPKGHKLARQEMRGKVLQLRIQGHNYDVIAETLGISRKAAARHVDVWLMEQTPAPEQVDALRFVMQARLDEMYARYWPRAMGISRTTGLDTAEGPQEKSAEILLKVMDRQSKLMGVDLQPNTTTLMISAESIAAYLGWDDAPEGPGAPKPIEVKAIELTGDEGDDEPDADAGLVPA